MAHSDFAATVTAAARVVARLEVKRRTARKRLDELDAAYRDAQRHLKLIVQTVEPYEPPPPELARAANDAADGV